MGLLGIFERFRKVKKAEEIDFKQLIKEYLVLKKQYASYLPSAYDLEKKFIELWECHSEKIKIEKELLNVVSLIRSEKYSELGRLGAKSKELGEKIKKINAKIMSLFRNIEYSLEILSKSENKRFAKEVKTLLSKIDREKMVVSEQEKIRKRMTA